MSVARRVHALRILALLALFGAGACRHTQDFMWVRDVPNTMFASDVAYTISAGDLIGVRVLGSDANSADRVRVREDGKISIPFLNDVEAAGSAPDDLARRLETKLKAYLVSPVVTIVIHERRPLRVAVVGKVARPGVYELDRGSGVVHALAAAGGLTPFADENSIYVIRSGYWADGNPAPARIRFRYDELLAGKVPASLFRLVVSDVVVAE
jgi:polysaccharide export outer membrane protein